MNKIQHFIEESKEKFSQLDLQDVKVRENLKHAKSKAKKLEKQQQNDKEKVVWRAAEAELGGLDENIFVQLE